MVEWKRLMPALPAGESMIGLPRAQGRGETAIDAPKWISLGLGSPSMMRSRENERSRFADRDVLLGAARFFRETIYATAGWPVRPPTSR